MSCESINYGNWVPKKLLYFWLLLSSIFFVLSLFPLLFFLNLIFWFLTGISLFLFLYFLYAYIIFNKNNGEFQTKLRNIVLEKLEWKGKGKALDIGTGAAPLAIMLAKRFPESEILGIDYWGKGWDYSKKLCEKNATIMGVADRIEFKKASAESLPFNNEEFDVAVSNFVFHEVRQAKDRRDVIKEALRVVRKGGIFSFQDLFLNKHYYGKTKELLQTIKSWGVEEVNFKETNNLIRIPRLLRNSMMLGKIGVLYGSPYTRTGGRGLDFISTILMRIKRSDWIKNQKGQKIGHFVTIIIEKNKVAPPNQTCTFPFYYDGTMPLGHQYAQIAIDLDLIIKKGSWYTLGNQNFQGLAELNEIVLKDKELIKKLDEAIKIGIKYRKI